MCVFEENFQSLNKRLDNICRVYLLHVREGCEFKSRSAQYPILQRFLRCNLAPV